MDFNMAINKITNMEIISKLLDSAAKNYDCRVKYNKDSQTIHFYGDKTYQRHIAEEVLSFFPKINKDSLDILQ